MSSIVAIILGYLLGSFPSAYILGRLLKGVDIRQLGDGNAGAANTFRQIGAGAGIVVGILDVGKGALAVFIAQQLAVSQAVVMATGLASVAGHNWPFALHFRGGRGAATAGGVLALLLPREMSILLAAAAVTLLLTRNATLFCGILFAPLPFVSWWLGAPWSLVTYSVALPVLVGITHFLSIRGAPATAIPDNAHPNSNGGFH